MDHPEKRYYKLIRFLLSINGLWPYQSVWSARLIRAIFTVILILAASIQLITIFTSDITKESLVIVIQSFIITKAMLYHIYAHIGHLDKFKELFERMWQDWALQKTDDEIRIMHEHAETTRLVTFYYTFLLYGLQMIYFIYICMPEILDVVSPMNESRPRRQPFDFNFLIDEERYFYSIRFYIFIMLIISLLIYLASFALFLTLTQHVCAMYKLLGFRAEHLFYVIGNAVENDLSHGIRIRYGNIAIFIRLHYNIIQFVDIIETCYTVPFLIDLLMGVSELSITLTQIPSIVGNMEMAMRSIVITLVTLCYLFVYNYMGQSITDMNSSIYEKLYNSVWYDAGISEQNSLLLIMKRCLHPFVLTACKFYAMSLQSFGMVLQTAISYCMFLKHI